MHSELFIAVLAGLGGMLGWGFADFFAKVTIDKIGDIASLAWSHICGTAALVIFVLCRFLFWDKPLSLPHDPNTWLLVAFFGAFQAAVYLFAYKGFGKGQIALLSPVFASFSGLTALFSIFIFKEVVSGYLLLALFIIFIGILVLNIDINSFKAKRIGLVHVPGFRDIAIATILAALWTVFWDRVVGGQDWLSYTLLMYAFMTLTVVIVARIQKVRLSVVKGSHMWKYLALTGIFETGAYLAISAGYSRTTFTSIIAIISGAFSLPTIILARTFLKERTAMIQTVGSVLIIIGIMVLSLN